MSDNTAPAALAAAPSPAALASKTWPDVFNTALHYAAGGGLIFLAAKLNLSQEVLASLVLGAAAAIGIKMGGAK